MINKIILALTIFGGISGIVAVAKDIYQIRSRIARIPPVRKLWWFLINKKILVKISVNKRYPIFEPDIDEIFKNVNEKIRRTLGNYIDCTKGKNYFQFVTEKMSAPIKFTFTPHINIETNEMDGITVYSKVLGNLIFVYREMNSYKDTIKILEEIYKTIEELYSIKPTYTNYSIQATAFEKFEEDWSIKREFIENDLHIKAGSKIIIANSKTILPLFDLEKYILKYITT